MTSPTDFRAQRYAATKSAAWLAGYGARLNQLTAFPPEPPYAGAADQIEFRNGWWRADDDYEFDREKRQPIHRRPSPMSALERDRP